MKNIKLILVSFLLIAFTGCQDDERDTQYLDNVQAPSDVSLQFGITQDNTGLVTITPTAVGATKFQIIFGDGTGESMEVEVGQSVDNVYAEGNYTVTAIATSINGLTTEINQQLVVSFVPPENLEITAAVDASNPFKVNVSATADYAAAFLVYFDTSNPEEEPTPLALGETVSNIYPLVGDYTIRVEALSGGTETTEGSVNVTILAPTELPIDFEAFDTTAFIGFGGASGAVIANPDTDGNPSATVAQIVKDGPEIWAGNVIELSAPIDFSTQKIIELDVWSPRAGGTLLLKLENLTDGGIFIEKQATLLGNSAWEHVTFDLSDVDTAQDYQKIVLFFDFGTVGDGSADWTFYIDNIDQTFAGVVTTQMIQDFEGPEPTFTSFGNIADIVVLANPDPTGANTTNTVAKLTKTFGSEVWAGAFFETLPDPIELASFGKINVKTWSPTAGTPVKLKLENVDASIVFEMDLATTVASEWEDLLFDFSEAPAADYVRVVIFFDFGTPGDDSAYYFDEIELVNESGNASLGFQDFEGDLPTFITFGNIADIEVIANPDPSGVNTTNTVAQLTKTAGSEPWAGSLFEVLTPLDLDSFSKISLKTWSPTAGIVVKLKLENADSSIVYEVDLNTTTAGEWEELVYDFSEAPIADYTKVVLFFDFGNPGDDAVYYYDEFALTN